ncbi:hypothetical protein [Microbacterium sp. MMO-56]|uniref:hypothetical protein n=1 Tax=Microbacterium sp. MMO-56 TaxID=3081281 RepID=UPI0030164950
MVMTPEDLAGVEANLARRVIASARTIAPCLDSLVAGSEEKLTAIAILLAVAGEVRARGSRQVASQRVGAASVAYRDVGSAFSDDDRSSLRGLCAASSMPSLPVGSFPPPALSIGRLWPEDCS